MEKPISLLILSEADRACFLDFLRRAMPGRPNLPPAMVGALLEAVFPGVIVRRQRCTLEAWAASLVHLHTGVATVVASHGGAA